MKKSGLGKGLDDLLGVKKEKNNTSKIKTKTNKSNKKTENIEILLNISEIEPNTNQPRKHFDKEKLQELAQSIKDYGIIQPIIVKQKGEKYEIVAGERRFRAASLANINKIPVIIKDYDDKISMEIAIIENIQRDNLNPIEEAKAYQSLIEEYNLTQEEVASRVSKNRTTITNILRLLKLDQEVQQLLIDEKITQGHARALITVDDLKLQKKLANDIIDKKLSVRELEKILKPKTKKKTTENIEKSIFIKDYEDKLKSVLGTRVMISQRNKDKGRIEIEYYSLPELERILELIENTR